MTEAIKIKANVKEIAGKGAARALRRENKVPAIIYGGNQGETMISLANNEFLKEYNRGNIESKLFQLELNEKIIIALPRSVQVDPVSGFPIHIDFQEVNETSQVRVNIHIKVINDDKSPGIKIGGVLNVPLRSLVAFCSPTNIPQHIIIDVANLEIGKSVHINDIMLPTGVVPLDKTNFVLASISGRTEEKEDEASTAAV